MKGISKHWSVYLISKEDYRLSEMKSISLWKDIGSKEAYLKNVDYFATPSSVLHHFCLHLAVQNFIWFPTLGQLK